MVTRAGPAGPPSLGRLSRSRWPVTSAGCSHSSRTAGGGATGHCAGVESAREGGTSGARVAHSQAAFESNRVRRGKAHRIGNDGRDCRVARASGTGSPLEPVGPTQGRPAADNGLRPAAKRPGSPLRGRARGLQHDRIRHDAIGGHRARSPEPVRKRTRQDAGQCDGAGGESLGRLGRSGRVSRSGACRILPLPPDRTATRNRRSSL